MSGDIVAPVTRRLGRRAFLASGALATLGCAAPRPTLTTAPRELVVSRTGPADHTTIQAAVDAAGPGDTITVHPGTYREQVAAWDKIDLHIVGTSRDDCILISSTGAYATPPIELGSGSLSNMTIIEDHADAGNDTAAFEDQRAYSIHMDFIDAMTGRTLLIEDCTIRNTRRAAIGCGLYQGTTITIRDCNIRSGYPKLGDDRTRGALYIHNRQSDLAETTDQHVILERNVIRCEEGNPFYLYDSGLDPAYRRSVMDVLCVDNRLHSGDDTRSLGGHGFTDDVTLHPDSRGNNVTVLNA